MIATRIRAFFDALLPYRAVNQMRCQIEDLKRERDYFRARSDRLELMLLAPFNKRLEQPIQGPKANQRPVGRKTWEQVKREYMEKEFAETKEEAKN